MGNLGNKSWFAKVKPFLGGSDVPPFTDIGTEDGLILVSGGEFERIESIVFPKGLGAVKWRTATDE